MKKYNKYLRPYCLKCNTIYSMIKNIGLKTCTHCQSQLQFKSFNPYPKLIAGLLILGLAIATVILVDSPIVWIGGFIWGIMMIWSSASTWDEIKELDNF